MRLISWNVNGIRAVQRKEAFSFLPDSGADIFCIQETKAHREQLDSDLTDVPGYHSFFSDAQRKGYSGTAVYSKMMPVSVQRGIGVEEFDGEGRVLQLDFENFSLINVYWPNGASKAERFKFKMDFYDAFLVFVKALLAEGKSLIICGDLNTAHREIDLAEPEKNAEKSGFLPEERGWVDKFLETGFADTFRIFNSEGENYTWWDLRTRARSRNEGWRIDYFFVSNDLVPSVKSAEILADVMGSDHCPITLEVEVPFACNT